MNANDYQWMCSRTSDSGQSHSDRMANAALGLAGEAGEIADIVKKYLHHGHSMDTAHIIKELGDLLWYVAEMASIFDIPLSMVMEININKLHKRYPDGFSSEASINRQE